MYSKRDWTVNFTDINLGKNDKEEEDVHESESHNFRLA